MTPVWKAKDAGRAKGRSFIYLLTVVAGANAGLIVSLLAALGWQECLIVMFAFSALAGGAVFTFFEMRELN